MVQTLVKLLQKSRWRLIGWDSQNINAEHPFSTNHFVRSYITT